MTKVNVGKSTNSVIIGYSVNDSKISIKNNQSLDVFDKVLETVQLINDKEERAQIKEVVNYMKKTVGSKEFSSHYAKFVSLTADHITLFTPFLSALAVFLA